MYVVLISEDHLPDAEGCLPPRVAPFRRQPAIPFSWWNKQDAIKRTIAKCVDGINYASPLVWCIIDTPNQNDLVAWLMAWNRLDFHTVMGKFWFDDLSQFENWLDKIGAAYERDSAEFKRLVDGWRV